MTWVGRIGLHVGDGGASYSNQDIKLWCYGAKGMCGVREWDEGEGSG